MTESDKDLDLKDDFEQDERSIVKTFVDGDVEEFKQRVHDTVVKLTRDRALNANSEDED